MDVFLLAPNATNLAHNVEMGNFAYSLTFYTLSVKCDNKNLFSYSDYAHGYHYKWHTV